MTTYTITTSVKYDDAIFSAGGQGARAGGDTYNIDGGTLTIDTDVRWCTNSSATIGPFGNITVSSSLGGAFNITGTSVRCISFTSDTLQTVPAIGTTITNGGAVSGELLGVWSTSAGAYPNSAPLASGAAMPATGMMKFRSVTGGAFATNDTIKNGATTIATASAADKVGWIEVVGQTATPQSVITVPRLGSATFTGTWLEVGTTNGTAGQVFQLPNDSGSTNNYYPGVWIETAVGSGIYKFWPAATAIVNGWDSTVFGTDARSKFVESMTNGQIRIGSNGTTNIGYVPVSGLKIRIPNIILRQCAPASRNLNTTPATNLTSRPSFVTTSNGSISVDGTIGDWYMSFSSPYALIFKNNAACDVSLDSTNPITAVDIDNIGNGIIVSSTYIGFNLNSVYNGGTISNIVEISRGLTGLQCKASGSTAITVTNIESYYTGTTTTATGIFIGGKSSSFNGIRIGNGNINIQGDSSVYSNITFHANFGGSTLRRPNAAITVPVGSDNIIDGFTVDSTASSQHPGLRIIDTGGTNTKFRNFGTEASHIDLANASQIVQSLGVNNVLQKFYIVNSTANLFGFISTTLKAKLENVKCTTNVNATIYGLENIIKGGYFNSIVASSGTYGTHFYDHFISDTTGRIGVLMCEPTSNTLGQCAVTGATVKFTGTAAVNMPTLNDTITWTMQYFALGHTGIDKVTITGTNIGNITFEYQIDKNNGSGFSAWKALYIIKTFATTDVDITLDKITVASHGFVTDSAVVFSSTGTVPGGLTAGTTYYVVNPTTNDFQVSATRGGAAINLTSQGTGTHTVTGTLISAETGISYTLGTKLKVRATVNTSNSSNQITDIDIATTTTSTARQTFYPADTVTLTLQNVVAGSTYRIEKYSTGTTTVVAATDLFTSTAHGLVAGDELLFSSTVTLPSPLSAGTVYYVISSGLTANDFKVSTTLGGATVDITDTGTGTHSWTTRTTIVSGTAGGTGLVTVNEVVTAPAASTQVKVKVRKSSAAVKYQPFETQATYTPTTGFSTWVSQVQDSIAA